MPLDAWLPVAYRLPSGERTRRMAHEAIGWQVYELRDGGRLLVVRPTLWRRWVDSGLISEGIFQPFRFGNEEFFVLSSADGFVLAPVEASKAPSNKAEALAFVQALRATRALDEKSGLQDAIYIEKLSLLMPTYTLSAPIADDVVLGTWMTDGVPVSVHSFRRFRPLMAWMGSSHLQDVLEQAGMWDSGAVSQSSVAPGEVSLAKQGHKTFELFGRPDLTQFINEHVIELIEKKDRYQALGIDFPSAIILHGPPGCGKTYAIERLVEYLGWPSFEIEASSVASPFIHETSKKVADVFEKAMQSAPSVLVIDEMEAFLADRQTGSSTSHHRVEEVAEFLRRIPEAIKNQVLIVAMTNRIEMIDPAILRRGRFDHVVAVEMASEAEVHALLGKLLGDLPCEADVEITLLARSLHGRPLSDVAFLVREGARLAARSGATKISQASLLAALESVGARGAEPKARKIGF